MARIRHQLAADIEAKKEEKRKKKELKKEHKRATAKKDKHHHHDSGNSDRRPDRMDRHRGGRSHSRDSQRGGSRDRHMDSQRGIGQVDSKRQRRSRSRSGSPDRGGREGRKGDRRGGSRDRSRGYRNDDRRDVDRYKDEREGRSRDGGSGLTEQGGYKRRRRSSSSGSSASPLPARHPPSSLSAQTPADEGGSRKKPDGDEKRYGLVKSSRHGQSSEGRGQDPSHLGPKVELLAKRTEQEAAAERERIAKVRKARGGQSGKIDDEERERRLQAMMRDAEVNDDIRSKRHRPSGATAKASEGAAAPQESTDGSDVVGVSKGSFLREMRSQVYKSETEGGTSMEETLSRSRHYHQKGSDLDSHGFMQR